MANYLTTTAQKSVLRLALESVAFPAALTLVLALITVVPVLLVGGPVLMVLAAVGIAGGLFTGGVVGLRLLGLF